MICNCLSISNIQPSSLVLNKIINNDELVTDPILLITSSGSDPSKEIAEFADKKCPTKYEEVALGGGQNQVALDKLKLSMKNGYWLCLKNLHLGISFLSQIENILTTNEKNEKFILILTSEPHDNFSSTLLQLCAKYSFESPPGIKYNVQNTWSNLGNILKNSFTPLKTKLFFNLSLFHALIQERRNYIPQGWVKFYEFS